MKVLLSRFVFLGSSILWFLNCSQKSNLNYPLSYQILEEPGSPILAVAKIEFWADSFNAAQDIEHICSFNDDTVIIQLEGIQQDIGDYLNHLDIEIGLVGNGTYTVRLEQNNDWTQEDILEVTDSIFILSYENTTVRRLFSNMLLVEAASHDNYTALFSLDTALLTANANPLVLSPGFYSIFEINQDEKIIGGRESCSEWQERFGSFVPGTSISRLYTFRWRYNLTGFDIPILP